jgi:hypothetical protein
LGGVGFEEEAFAVAWVGDGGAGVGVDDDVVEDAALGGEEDGIEPGAGTREEVGGDDALEVLCGVRAGDGD